jgi:3-hydroxyisobutyrate dehydrogenase
MPHSRIETSPTIAIDDAAALSRVGLDPGLLLEAIGGGPLDSPYFPMKGKTIIERQFDPQFSLKLAAKDGHLIDDAIRNHQLDLPLVSAAVRRLDESARQHPSWI